MERIIETIETEHGQDVRFKGDLVRCKDCKYLEHMYALDELNGKKCYVCKKHTFTGLREENWFCADGKRKDSDDQVTVK